MRSVILSLLGLFIIVSAHAQSKEPFNSGVILKKGLSLHDEGKYKEAIKYYNQIPRNDTNYATALYEKALSLYMDSNYTASKKACAEGLTLLDKTNELSFYLTYASCFDNMLEYQKALDMYDSAARKYPNAPSLHLNKAIVYLRMKKYDEAETILERLLIANPYYGSAHYYLGKAAYLKGQLVPATLSFFTYLLCEPEGKYRSYVINHLSQISKASDEVMDLVNNRQEEPVASFASIEQIVLSKIALDKNYRSIVSLDDEIIRQLQVIFEKMQFVPTSNNFWMQFYVPVFKAVYDQKQFEPAVFQAFSGIQMDAIKRYVKSNSKEINKAVETITTQLNELRSTRELNYIKRGDAPRIYHFSDGAYVAKGKLLAGDKLSGPFEFYYSNGNLKSKGSFDENGKKTGAWTFYYQTGEVSSIEHFQNNEAHGDITLYYINGSLKEQSVYQNGKLEGEQKTYYYIGTPKLIQHFKGDQLEGKVERFSPEGRKLFEANYVKGEVDGHELKYYKNGQIQSDIIYSNGKYDGLYKDYYDNGQVSFECNYVQGKAEGVVKDYHRNGKLSKERTYNYSNFEPSRTYSSLQASFEH